LGDLYDIGFDKPETHVVQKGDTLFYAFYADNYHGKVKFKGLPGKGKFLVYDYVNRRKIGEITNSEPQISVNFKKHLLVWVHKD
jgi:alpha-galactosidase